MYSITHTKGIVLKSYDLGERDLFLSIFTRDLGHIYARVGGVRDLNSKHRYSVQEYSLSDFALVKGKTGWKITNSSLVKSFYFDLSTRLLSTRVEALESDISSLKRKVILKILFLVRRFYLGEEANEKIFEDLVSGFEKILKSDSIEDLELEEAKTVANFLYDLGYVEENVQLSVFSVRELRKIINKGIKNSGL